MPRLRLHRRADAILLVSLLAPAPLAHAQSRPERPLPYAIRNVRTSLEADAPARTILLRDGRIEAIADAASAVPPGHKVLEGEGWIALPAFLDAWTSSGCTLPEPVNDHDRPAPTDANVHIDMREANRKGIQPAFHAVDVVDLGEDVATRHRERGFGLLLSAPRGELLAGWSALLATRDAPTRDLVVRSEVFQHAAFRARGEGYPGTLMGYFAQLRQLFLDADRQQVLLARHEQGRPGPRPPWDRDLDAAARLFDGRALLVCEADRAADVRRWLALADEHGLSIAISGGREAWKVADELARRRVPVFLTLDWGDEVDDPRAKDDEKEKDEPPPPGRGRGESATPGVQAPDDEGGEASAAADAEKEAASEWEYVEPEAVRLERRREWEETRDCAIRLHEAGVRFALCTGAMSPADFTKNLRALVEAGLPEHVAIASLTAAPASLLGVEREFGFLTPGHSATLALWTASPTSKDAQLAWLFVEGHAQKFELDAKKKEEKRIEPPAEGVDLTGRWTITGPPDEGRPPSHATLEMKEDGSITGTLHVTVPDSGEPIEGRITGRLAGDEVTLESTLSYQGLEMTWTLRGHHAEGAIRGERRLESASFQEVSEVTAAREPDGSPRRVRDARTGGAR